MNAKLGIDSFDLVLDARFEYLCTADIVHLVVNLVHTILCQTTVRALSFCTCFTRKRDNARQPNQSRTLNFLLRLYAVTLSAENLQKSAANVTAGFAAILVGGHENCSCAKVIPCDLIYTFTFGPLRNHSKIEYIVALGNGVNA